MIKWLLPCLVLAGCQDPLCQQSSTRGSIGEQVIMVEIACSDAAKMQGLMYRRQLPENAGMLFIYPQEDLYRFWMKNTYIPLSIAFLDKNKKIVHIADMKPEDLTPVATPIKAMYALEMNQGWFKRYGIGQGDRLAVKEP